MATMTEPQWRAFLAEGTRTGKLASVTRDGSPTSVPIWFLLDGDTLVFTTWHESAKAKHFARDPRAALVVDDEAYPFSYVLVRGTVEWEQDADDIADWSRRLAERYMPAEHVGATAERNAVPGEWLCRLRIERVVAQAAIAAD